MKRLRTLLLVLAAAIPAAGAQAGEQPPPAQSAGPAPAPAADPSAAARAAYQRGAALYREGRYREAIEAFEEADRLKPSPALQFNMGQAWEKLSDLPAALAAFARYLRADPEAPNRDAVARQVRGLEVRLAKAGLQMLHVTTVPAAGEVSVDGGTARPTPLDAPFAPGRHALAASAPGRAPATREIDLPADRSLAVEIALEPAPPAPEPAAAAPPVLAATPPAPPLEATRPAPAPQPVGEKSWVGPIVAGAVGVAAASAGLVFGLLARNAQNELLSASHDRAEADQLVSRARTDATTANVLFGVAGAAVLTGGVLAVAF